MAYSKQWSAWAVLALLTAGLVGCQAQAYGIREVGIDPPFRVAQEQSALPSVKTLRPPDNGGPSALEQSQWSEESAHITQAGSLPDSGQSSETDRQLPGRFYFTPQEAPQLLDHGGSNGGGAEPHFAAPNRAPVPREMHRPYVANESDEPMLKRVGDRIRDFIPTVPWPQPVARHLPAHSVHPVVRRAAELPAVAARVIPLPLRDAQAIVAKEAKSLGWSGMHNWGHSVMLESPENANLISSTRLETDNVDPESRPLRQSSPSNLDPEGMRVPVPGVRLASDPGKGQAD